MLAMLDESSQTVAGTLSTYPVDRPVNSVRTVDHEDPSLVDPAPNRLAPKRRCLRPPRCQENATGKMFLRLC